MLVMLEMIEIVDPRDGADCTKNAQIVEQIIVCTPWENPSVKPVVRDDE
jgi:hypothetical protein